MPTSVELFGVCTSALAVKGIGIGMGMGKGTGRGITMGKGTNSVGGGTRGANREGHRYGRGNGGGAGKPLLGIALSVGFPLALWQENCTKLLCEEANGSCKMSAKLKGFGTKGSLACSKVVCSATTFCSRSMGAGGG